MPKSHPQILCRAFDPSSFPSARIDHAGGQFCGTSLHSLIAKPVPVAGAGLEGLQGVPDLGAAAAGTKLSTLK